MAVKEAHQCEKMITDGWHSHSCSRKGINFEDDKWWCKQHTPSIIKARNEAQMAKWKRELEERCAKRKEDDRIQGIKDKLYAAYLSGRIDKEVIEHDN